VTQKIEWVTPASAHLNSAEQSQTASSANRRRVFFLVDSFLLGGTETQAVELARRLDPARYDVIVGCLRQEGPLLMRLENTPVRVTQVEMAKGIDSPSGMLAILKLARFLRRQQIDIMHAHDLWSNMIGMSAAILARVPVRITSQRDLSHDAWYKSYRRRVLRFLQAKSSAVLTNAEAIREGLIREDGLSPEKVKVVHNGVDLERFQSIRPNREALFPASPGKTLIVLVGNMNSDVKGHPYLIEAAREIVRDFPAAQFVLVGDGPKRTEYETQVAALGLCENFVFMGRRTDVPEILACCEVAVLPSLAEGLPNAVLEYLAAGLPVVATGLGGNVEVIQNGVNGLLIPPKDPQALAAALTRLLEDEKFRRNLGASGRRHVAENFSFVRLVREVDNLYTGLLQSAGRLPTTAN
jgi:glycosyltransferase involved in cell wall biosynthesis